MLAVNNLSCVRGERALFSGISFTVQPGELLHVHGPNGSGKTSLLRMLCGLSAPAEGEILWQSQTLRALGDAFFAEVTYLGHQNAIKDELSAIENLRISASIAGGKLSEEQAYAGLEAFGLTGKVDLQTKVLSQGQRRRVALARLPLSKGLLWILDEPLAALDTVGVALVEKMLDAHLVRGGLAVVTTHQPLKVAGTTQHVHLGVSGQE